MEEFAKLIDDYNSKKKPVDKVFIDTICLKYVNSYNLNKYLQNVYVTNKSLKYGHGVYNSFDRTLTVNIKDDLYPNLKVLLGEEAVEYNNLIILRLLLHELAHVSQEKLMYEGDDSSLESLLIKLNNYLYFNPNYIDSKKKPIVNEIRDRLKLISYFNYYRKNQEKAPIERMADIKSYQDINKIIDNVPDNSKGKAYIEFSRDNNSDLIDTSRFGYRIMGDKTNSPSLDFLRKINFLKDIFDERKILDISNYSDLGERLYLGLPLSRDEYIQLENNNPLVKRK